MVSTASRVGRRAVKARPYPAPAPGGQGADGGHPGPEGEDGPQVGPRVVAVLRGAQQAVQGDAHPGPVAAAVGIVEQAVAGQQVDLGQGNALDFQTLQQLAEGLPLALDTALGLGAGTIRGA